MEKILFVDACVRPESRTRKLAEYLMKRLPGEVEVVDLQREGVVPLNGAGLAARDEALSRGDLEDPSLRYARQFAGADTIVIAAPYWDLSFPALLKSYMEQVTAVGVTFAYGPEGRPYGLCRAKRLFYVTTAGGSIFSEEYGYGYIRTLCTAFYGVPEVPFIKAEGLDVFGADVEDILAKTKDEIDSIPL